MGRNNQRRHYKWRFIRCDAMLRQVSHFLFSHHCLSLSAVYTFLYNTFKYSSCNSPAIQYLSLINARTCSTPLCPAISWWCLAINFAAGLSWGMIIGAFLRRPLMQSTVVRRLTVDQAYMWNFFLAQCPRPLRSVIGLVYCCDELIVPFDSYFLEHIWWCFSLHFLSH